MSKFKSRYVATVTALKVSVISTLFLTGLLIMSVVSAHAEDKTRIQAEKAFHQADVVNDGRIDQGEFDMYHQLIFRALDSSRDGVLTLDECAGSCFKPNAGSNDAAASGVLHYKFEEIDADGSGQLREYEYILYARERFGDFDTNHDNVIDIDEFCAFYREAMPCTFASATDKLR